jgi:putative transposase
MAKAVRAPRAGASYVTTATDGRHPIFEISRVADLSIETLLHYRVLGHYKLHAYVVMPDHVHLLLTPQSITLDEAVALIKNGFAHRLESGQPVWEDTFTAHSIANLHDLEAVRAYLHQLPLRANLVPAAELYPHSSAYRQSVAQPMLGSRPVQSAPPASLLPSENERKPAHSTATSLRKVAS